MLVYVPQFYVALVYAGGELRAVVEAGIGFVPPSQGLEVRYVYLQPQPPVPYFEDEGEVLEAFQPETMH